MAAWEIKPLGELCDVVGGGTPPKNKPEFYSGDIPWATVRDMKFDLITQTEFKITKEAVAASATNVIPSGNVVIATRVGLGKVCLIEQPTAINQDLRGIIPKNPKALSVRYLFWWLKSIASLIEKEGTGATVQGVKLPFVKGLPLPYPSFIEQRLIVAILDEAFEGIATAKANAGKNLQNARELFDSHLLAVFSQQGEGWTTKTVQQLVGDGFLAKPQDGNHGEIHPTKADYVDVGVPFIMAADLIDGEVDTQGCRFIADKQARSLRIGFAKAGDVLLSHKGTIGRVAILDTGKDYVVLTPQVTYYRSLDNNRLFNGFLYYCLRSPGFQAEMNRIAGAGSTRAYIGITRQLDLQIALPPIDAQHELAAQLRHSQEISSSLASIYERKIAALDELKKSLLHQAFTGALTTKSTDSQVAEVA